MSESYRTRARKWLGELTEGQCENIQQPEDAVMAFAKFLDTDCGCLFKCHHSGKAWCLNCADRHAHVVLDGAPRPEETK